MGQLLSTILFLLLLKLMFLPLIQLLSTIVFLLLLKLMFLLLIQLLSTILFLLLLQLMFLLLIQLLSTIVFLLILQLVMTTKSPTLGMITLAKITLKEPKKLTIKLVVQTEKSRKKQLD